MSMRYAHVVSLIAAMVVAVGSTDLEDFFQRIHNEGEVTTYQCYRNGTLLEPSSSHDFTVMWKGSDQPNNEAELVCTFQIAGDSENQRFEASAEYESQGDYANISRDGEQVRLYQLQPPYQGEAYYFKEVADADGNTVFKIYDADETCTNAETLRNQVCPEPCDLEYPAEPGDDMGEKLLGPLTKREGEQHCNIRVQIYDPATALSGQRKLISRKGRLTLQLGLLLTVFVEALNT